MTEYDSKQIGSRIRELRLLRGLSQEELCEKIGYKSKSTITKIESGERQLKQSKIKPIADVLQTTPAFIMGWNDNPEKNLPSEAISLNLIPVLGHIPAGYPNYEEEEIIGYQAVAVNSPEEYFCLEVHGDSMTGRGIPDGSKVVIHRQPTAEDGDVVACRVNGDEATLKIFTKTKDSVILTPANSKYKPIIVNGSDFDSGTASIYGVVTQIIIDV